MSLEIYKLSIMTQLNKLFKLFTLDPLEADKEVGNYPLQSIVPYGPAHETEVAAQTWLKEHGQEKKYYIIMPIFMVKKE